MSELTKIESNNITDKHAQYSLSSGMLKNCINFITVNLYFSFNVFIIIHWFTIYFLIKLLILFHIFKFLNIFLVFFHL